MKMLYRLGFVSLSLVIVLSSEFASAQITAGAISGTIKDESGAIVPGATIIIKHTATGTTRMAFTDGEGRYRAPGLAPGEYELRAELSGFKTEVRTGVALTIGREAIVDFTMTVGELAEQVTVSGEVPLVNTTSSTLAGLVDPRQIRDLPLNGRSFADLSTLDPGVQLFRNAVSPRSITLFGGRGVRIAINGARPEFNLVLTDGTDALDAFGNAPGSVAGVLLGVDTVREFQTLTSTYSAEFGRVGGGVINTVTRSGSNELGGSLFEFHRNSSLDARNFFDPGQEPPEFKRNQFGFTIGGPMVKDKSFFFASYEGLRERLGLTKIARVPSRAGRNGELPGRRVPVNPLIRPFLDLYPLPNGRDFGDGTAEFLFGFRQPTDEDFFVIRLDHNFSDKHSFFARYTFDDASKDVTFPLPPDFVRQLSRQQIFTFDFKSIISPELLNVFRLGFNRSKIRDASLPEVVAAELSFIGDDRGRGNIDVEGLTPLGSDTKNVTNMIQNLFEYSDDLTHTSGKHAFKAGFNVKRFQYNVRNTFLDRGLYIFFGLEDFLSAFPFIFLGTSPDSDLTNAVRMTMFGFYLQDDLRVSPNLTLNLGLRYEFITTPHSRRGKSANFVDPERDAAPVLGKFMENPSLMNFMPRVGLAWDPSGDGETAVRAGFGLFYNQLGLPNFVNGFTLNPPFTTITQLIIPPFPVVPRESFIPLFTNPVEFDGHTPYVIQYNLNVQRQLFRDTVFTVGYVGSRGVNLPRPTDINSRQRQILPDGRAFFPADAPRVNPNFRSINLRDFGGNSHYNSLQLSLRKQFSHGLQFQASYTLAKSIDDAPPILRDIENAPGILYDYRNRRLDRSLSPFDIRHNLVLNYVYDLPLGPGKSLGGRAIGFAGKLLEGWQLNGIITIASGNPFTVTNGFDRSRIGTIGPFRADRPNLRPGASNNPKIGSPDRWFDSSAFELQPAGFLGDLGRNTLIGPGLASFDFALFKTTSIGERAQVQFRAEFFNIFNRANFATPEAPNRVIFTDPRGIPSAAAGRLTNTVTSSRQVQFGLKLIF